MAGYSSANYKDAICAGLYGMLDCNSDRILVKVDVFGSFSDAAAAIKSPRGSDCATDASACDWTAEETFKPGSGSDIVVVQAYYKWPTIVDLPWFNLATLAGDDRLLSGIRVFRNEPFS